MPILTPTDHFGRIDWLGLVTNRAQSLRAAPAQSVEVDWAGFVGDCHSGLTRASCVRVRAQFEPGTEIRNTRQISALSVEELAVIAAEMGMADLPPAWLGASMTLAGIPDFTRLAPSSRLISDSGVSLVVDMENAPCQFPAREIETERPGFGKAFMPAARGRRGVTLWVERPGVLRLGDRMRLHVPPQRIHAHV